MERNGPRELTPSYVDLADYLDIEQGRLVTRADQTEQLWFPLDDISLTIRDSEGSVSVTGKLYLDDATSVGPAALSAVTFHSGNDLDRLSLTVSLFDLWTVQFEAIGTSEVNGGSDQISRFDTTFTSNDSRIGDRGEIRFRLTVGAPDTSTPVGYVVSIKAVGIRFIIEEG